LVTPSAQSRKVPTFTESPEAGGVMYVLLPPVLHLYKNSSYDVAVRALMTHVPVPILILVKYPHVILSSFS
jgi:hypothetical protein